MTMCTSLRVCVCDMHIIEIFETEIFMPIPIIFVNLGFNCGEAVNFATSDWFPLGATASKRYAHLRMLPIIPYEELLCKEAMLVYKSSKVTGSKNKYKDLASHSSIFLSFMHLVRFYKQAISRLHSSRQLSSSSNSLGNLTCSRCHRDCYIAYIMCKHCYSHPICLFHG